MAAKKELNQVIESKIVESSLEDVMHNSMMPYSEYVILDRALPRVEDGLKPVQRRILYAMMELGVTPDKPYRKSARIVGDCLGKYHPHGDTSVYDAMVRMAQEFRMSVPLVDGHGNYGSVDGDSAAAMRYTEARLQPIAMEMLKDLEKNTVTWSLNFDDTLKEPDILPSRFPNLLVNGASGIAVGLSTNIPPHNLGEVIDGVIAYIDNPRISLVNMMKIIKGPDFPTGGFIIAGEELFNAYLTGKGKIKLRAKMEIEVDAGKKYIVITEIPYGVNKASLLQKINELREDGKRKELFADIADIVDESDRNGMRAVIKLKKDANTARLIPALYKFSDLEVTFGINMLAIADGRPQQLGLLEMLKYYVEYQRLIVHKRTQFDLAAARAREHILSGLIIAIKNIDEIIKIIRGSKNQTEAKAAMRQRFNLSEKQVQAIVDMRLGRLTKLEITNLQNELASVRECIKEYEFILSSQKNEYNVVKKEISDLKRAYKSARRSEFLSESKAVLKIPERDTNAIEEKEGWLIVGGDGNVKYVSNRAFSQASESADGLSTFEVISHSVKCDNLHNVSGFTNMGNFVNIDISKMEEQRLRSKGLPLEKICPEAKKDEVLVAAFDNKALLDKKLMFFTKMGMVKLSAAAEYSLNKKYYQAIVLKDGDLLVNVEILDREDMTMLYVSKDGMTLNAEISDVAVQGRKSAGVKGMQLSAGDSVVFAGLTDNEGEVIVATDKGFAKRVIIADIEVGKRYRKGLKICDLGARGGNAVIFASLVKRPYDIAAITDGGVAGISSEDIPVATRQNKCKEIFKNLNIVGISQHLKKESNL